MKIAQQIVDAIIVAGVRAVAAELVEELKTGVSPSTLEKAELLQHTIMAVADTLYIPVAIEVAKAVPAMQHKIPDTLSSMQIIQLAGKIFSAENVNKVPERVAEYWMIMTHDKGQPTA